MFFSLTVPLNFTGVEYLFLDENYGGICGFIVVVR